MKERLVDLFENRRRKDIVRVVNSAISPITETLENKVASFSGETRPSQYCLTVLSALKYTVRAVPCRKLYISQCVVANKLDRIQQ